MLPAEAGEMSVPSHVLAGIWGQQHALPYLPLGGIFHLMSIAPSIHTHTHTPSASSPGDVWYEAMLQARKRSVVSIPSGLCGFSRSCDTVP
jgi:hypothetical protein